MEGNLAVTYSLIYAFLRKQAQTKAADAVKKAARNIIVLKDDLQLEGPHLDEIVEQWKQLQAAGSSSDSDSSDDSSDDSSSSSSSSNSSSSSSSSESTSSSDEESSSSESEEGTEAHKKEPMIIACAERDSSVTLSSDAKASEIKSRIPPVKPEESSESDSDSDDSTSESASDQKPVAKAAPKKDSGSSDSESSSSSSESSSSSSESSSSSSESSSSSSESESKAEITQRSDKNPTKDIVASSKSGSMCVVSISKEETRVAKKRKTSESGAAVVTAVAVIPPSDHVQVSVNKNTQGNGNNKPRRVAGERFSRIKPQAILPEQLLNNAYEAKDAIANDYGTRAHRDLIVTRGAGFRKEKNKKKRGSYRGGEITLQSHSIKFTD